MARSQNGIIGVRTANLDLSSVELCYLTLKYHNKSNVRLGFILLVCGYSGTVGHTVYFRDSNVQMVCFFESKNFEVVVIYIKSDIAKTSYKIKHFGTLQSSLKKSLAMTHFQGCFSWKDTTEARLSTVISHVLELGPVQRSRTLKNYAFFHLKWPRGSMYSWIFFIEIIFNRLKFKIPCKFSNFVVFMLDFKDQPECQN